MVHLSNHEKETAQPLYFKIKSKLLEAIASGQLQPGDRVSSERELTDQFGVSRMTARQALVELELQGYLQRVQGKGTFVNTPKLEQPLLSLTSFTEDMLRRGMIPGSQLLVAEETPAGRRASQMLNIRETDPVVRLERLRLAGGDPMALEIVHLPAALVPGLLQSNLTGSVYRLLAESYGINLARASQSLEAVAARAYEEKILGVKEGTPLLMMERVAYDELGRTVEYTKSLYRGDRYRFTTELSRQAQGRV